MKKSAIARIVIWSVVALVLTGILIGTLIFRENPNAPIIFGKEQGYKYSNEKEYAVGASEMPAESFTSISVDWISGNVYVLAYDGDTVKFEESSNDVIEEKYELRWRVKENILYIKPCQSTNSWNLSNEIPAKDLFVYLPETLAKTMNKISVDTASARIGITGITANKIDTTTASGDIWFEKCGAIDINIENVSGYVNITETNMERIDAETVSGNVEIMGAVKELRADSVSGTVLLCTGEAPQSADVSTVSGDIKFELPENDGFYIDFDSVSGKVTSEFSLIINNGKKVYGNGQRRFDFETVSGNAYLEIKE
ncbi:MAG: DUF4097 family beta strand repeat protein [Clostridia bacterium]|nr:DUF4097 family beta strand repeat protein [Clostridia bacterium]